MGYQYGGMIGGTGSTSMYQPMAQAPAQAPAQQAGGFNLGNMMPIGSPVASMITAIPEISKMLFGTKQNSTSTTNRNQQFNQSQIPLFQQQMAQANQVGDNVFSSLEQRYNQNQASLAQRQSQERAMYDMFGNKERRETLQRAKAQVGQGDQALASRGLYNSSLAAGNRNAIARQTNDQLADITQAQQQQMGQVMARQSQETGGLEQALTNLAAQMGLTKYQLATLLPQDILNKATSTTETTKSKTKNPGLFG